MCMSWLLEIVGLVSGILLTEWVVTSAYVTAQTSAIQTKKSFWAMLNKIEEEFDWKVET